MDHCFQVYWHVGRRHLVYLEPVVTIFGLEGGAGGGILTVTSGRSPWQRLHFLVKQPVWQSAEVK